MIEAEPTDPATRSVDLGSGCTGTVRAEQLPDGKWVAVKELTSLTVNRATLEQMVWRSQQYSWANGAAPVLSTNWLSRPPTVTSELFADVDSSADALTISPRNLQRDLLAFTTSEKTLSVLRQLCEALFLMHQRRIAHGNLKPGHVFFAEDGSVFLSDWAQGLMPEVQHLPWTDALLYAAPEQIENSYGYRDEEGYRWDVFAFGVLAFRLLEGRFPFANDQLSALTPERGGVGSADEIRQAVLASGDLEWQLQTDDPDLLAWREILEKCLKRSPGDRFCSMVEVYHEREKADDRLSQIVAQAEYEAAVVEERSDLMFALGKAKAKGRGLKLLTGLAVLCALTLAGFWAAAEFARRMELKDTRQAQELLKQERDDAFTQRQVAEHEKVQSFATLEKERETWQARFATLAGLTGLLFDQPLSMKSDEARKKIDEAEGVYLEIIAAGAKRPGLESEVAAARLQLAMIALARKDGARAEREIQLIDPQAHPQLTGRTDRLYVRLAELLFQEGEGEKASKYLRKAVDSPDFETSLAARRGLAQAALINLEPLAARAQFSIVVDRLREASEASPEDSALLHRAAEAQLELARVCELTGDINPAQDLRSVTVLLIRPRIDSGDAGSRDYSLLLKSHLALASTATKLGDESLAREEISLAEIALDEAGATALEELRAEQIEMLYVDALLQDKTGSPEVAMSHTEEAIQVLKPLVNRSESQSVARLQCGLFLLLKSQLVSRQGDLPKGLELGELGLRYLKAVQNHGSWQPLRDREIEKAIAQSAQRLGESALIMSRHDEARSWFKRSKDAYRVLTVLDPRSQSNSAALAAVEKRVAELN